MLDMGFLPEMQWIVHAAEKPKKGERRILMFSATFPDEVQHLAKDFFGTSAFSSPSHGIAWHHRRRVRGC